MTKEIAVLVLAFFVSTSLVMLEEWQSKAGSEAAIEAGRKSNLEREERGRQKYREYNVVADEYIKALKNNKKVKGWAKNLEKAKSLAKKLEILERDPDLRFYTNNNRHTIGYWSILRKAGYPEEYF